MRDYPAIGRERPSGAARPTRRRLVGISACLVALSFAPSAFGQPNGPVDRLVLDDAVPFEARALWLLASAVALVVLVVTLYALRRPQRAGKLIFLDGPRKGETVLLSRRLLSIGALPDNDIVVPSQTVSRYHAQIHWRGREVEIRDVGSSNGTFVNGAGIHLCPLEPGDKLRIGDVELVYER